MTEATEIDVHRASERFVTRVDGIESHHVFSFGRHYDPARTGVAGLVALNDETVEPGHGFGPHPHANVEIVTWVVRGSLRHIDNTGVEGVLEPDVVQCLFAGTGVVHSETNAEESAADGSGSVRFVQMWMTPHETGGRPGYQQHALDPGDLTRGWVVLASGSARHRGTSTVRLSQVDTALYATRLAGGQRTQLPLARQLWGYVVRGEVEYDSHGLAEGDSIHVRGGRGQSVLARTDAELLVWDLGD